MSESRIISLVKAIVSALNAAQPVQPEPPEPQLPSPFVLPFTAAWKATPIMMLDQMGQGLFVYIVPLSADEQRVGDMVGGDYVGQHEILIAVYRRILSGETQEDIVSQMLLLMEQMLDVLKSGSLAIGDSWRAVPGNVSNVSYSHSDLADIGVFSGSQTVNYALFGG